jgi:hypothetical protein
MYSMIRRTTLADRQQIVALKKADQSHQAVADATGWSVETVREVWRNFQKAEEAGPTTAKVGRPATGPLSTFDPLVRYAALRRKLERPQAGPDVILADMAIRPSLRGLRVPSSSSLGAYFKTFEERLVTPRPHLQLPGQSSQLAPVTAVHECWLLDFDEGLNWSGVGWTNVMNLTDLATGIKIGSYVHPAGSVQKRHLIPWEQIQANLRLAFSRWGLPDRIRTDRDRRLVAPGEYPVPMPFTLWLAGLGIQHEIIQRVTQNGGVERFHRTWEGRLLDLPLGSDWQDVQDYVNYEVWRMNAVLPSRGRNCRRRPPLLVYPEARTPRRYYSRQEELHIFQLKRVEEYLSTGRWLRRTSTQGQFRFHSDSLNARRPYTRQIVVVTFHTETGQFQVRPAESDDVILRFRPDWLSVTAITGLEDEKV